MNVMLVPLLIEIGVEELPAIPLLKVLPTLQKSWVDILERYSLGAEFEFFYTPRRLVLWHREFKIEQDAKDEEFFGAPLAIAYKEGEPTPAAIGFAKKCGVDVSALSSAKKGNKEVLYYKKSVAAQPTTALLEAMIGAWLKSLDFGKSMRWGTQQEAFIRPIRWVNVLLDDTLVPMTLYGVASEANTYPHRQVSFDAVPVSSSKAYFEVMQKSAVELFQQRRKEKILEQINALEQKHHIRVEIDEALLQEVVAITEYPTALLGSFDEAFLVLPQEVIITSMKEHQRYFPVYKEERLTNAFVVVSNAYCEDFSHVIDGNERVLRPRLADGLFFYENDLKRGLIPDGLEKVVFMDGLGTLVDKIERERNIATALCETLQFTNEAAEVQRALSLAKCDLMSEMVYEFTELQGIMGYYYAEALNEPKQVALAIKEQYLPTGEKSELPSTTVSALVALSIKLDTLIGLFSINKIPTGSRDPFALRRAVIGIIRICLAHNIAFRYKEQITQLAQSYSTFDTVQLHDFFSERIVQFYKGINPSIVKAVLSSGEENLLLVDEKVMLVNDLVQSESYKAMSATFNRVANIVKAMELTKHYQVNSELLTLPQEQALYSAYEDVTKKHFATQEALADALFSLKPAIDAFFDNVMVNVDDAALQENRKALIMTVYQAFLALADFKEISV